MSAQVHVDTVSPPSNETRPVPASDAELLMRFVRYRDENAFEELVKKHASLVLGTCRQILRDQHDVDDAFQATFLVFLRRASKIRKRNLLHNWLYGDHRFDQPGE